MQVLHHVLCQHGGCESLLALRLLSNRLLCISWVSPADFSGFIYKVVTRQKLKLTNGFEFHSCCLLQLCVAPTATRFKTSGRMASDG